MTRIGHPNDTRCHQKLTFSKNFSKKLNIARCEALIARFPSLRDDVRGELGHNWWGRQPAAVDPQVVSVGTCSSCTVHRRPWDRPVHACAATRTTATVTVRLIERGGPDGPCVGVSQMAEPRPIIRRRTVLVGMAQGWHTHKNPVPVLVSPGKPGKRQLTKNTEDMGTHEGYCTGLPIIAFSGSSWRQERSEMPLLTVSCCDVTFKARIRLPFLEASLQGLAPHGCGLPTIGTGID